MNLRLRPRLTGRPEGVRRVFGRTAGGTQTAAEPHGNADKLLSGAPDPLVLSLCESLVEMQAGAVPNRPGCAARAVAVARAASPSCTVVELRDPGLWTLHLGELLSVTIDLGGDVQMSLLDQTLTYDEMSSLFWSEHLARYGARMRKRSNIYAVAAAVVSTITGATIWTTFSKSPETWAQILVGAIAVLAAVLALIPKLWGYSDCAINAPAIGSKYGKQLEKLRKAHDDLDAGVEGASDKAWAAIIEFYDIREEKEKLTPYPSKLQAEATELYRTAGVTQTDRGKVIAERGSEVAGKNTAAELADGTRTGLRVTYPWLIGQAGSRQRRD